MTTDHPNPAVPPAATAAALRALLDTELSTSARLWHVALLLVSLAMTAVAVSLWATEPSLPARTQLAFAAMTLIGVGWAVHAIRVLGSRRVLLAKHRVVAGWMAVTFTSVFASVSVAAVFLTGAPAARGSMAFAAVMWVVALALLGRARRENQRLEARRRELEQKLVQAS